MPNLVVNPGAENSFSFWSPRVDSAQKGWVDGGVNSHTGARNFITLSTSLCTMNQTITSFVPNTNYTVSLWIKLINTGSGYVNLRINNETLISSTDFTTNYKQFYATAPYVPSSSNEVLSISGYTSAFLIIDDISVDGLVPPTSSPTTKPSTIPTIAPTAIITVSPTKTPTLAPTIQPSKHPSSQPTAQPSAQPSSSPSSQPTVQPSEQPSSQPSNQPTAQPTE
ncbi:MAG: PT domain-containing protein, partial [Rickettsiales bacterium]